LAKETGGIIIFTLVNSALRQLLRSEAAKQEIRAVDLMGPLLDVFTEYLGSAPIEKPGIQREISERYFKRIEAIEYTVNHDDGQDPYGLHLANIVIVGVSRTSKTPLSMFLSTQYFLRIANIPVVLEVELPHQLFGLDRNRVVGLSISAERLMEIRKARLEHMGFTVPKYAEYDQIEKELEYSNRLFATKGWSVIDVTEKSVEEVASEILQLKNIQLKNDE
ncbi:MAG: pyruvate, water dikinase regulatory protein, partial [Candidatus Bathyarchaeota archaeon]